MPKDRVVRVFLQPTLGVGDPKPLGGALEACHHGADVDGVVMVTVNDA